MFINLRRSLLILIILSISSIIILFLLSRRTKNIDQPQQSSELIERLCKPNNDKCFEVYDRLILNKEGEHVERILNVVHDSGMKYIESCVGILPNRTNATFADSDTRLWTIDGNNVSNDIKGMNIMTYLMDIFKLKTKEDDKNIALIGLRGGTFISHLRKRIQDLKITVVEPEEEMIHIAKKWFELSEATIENEKGINWIKKTNDSKFDVIYLNACERRSYQHCPIPSLTTKNSVKLLYSRLNRKSRALLVINFEIFSADRIEILNDQITTLLEFFPHCLSIDFISQPNIIVACSNKHLPHFDKKNPRASLESMMSHITDRYHEINTVLNYGNIVKELTIHALIDKKRNTVVHIVENNS